MRTPRNFARHFGRAIWSLRRFATWKLAAGGLWNEYVLRRAHYVLRTPNALHPLVVRRETSDLAVFVLIFILEEYAAVREAPGVDIVLDCGANVGYAAAYFLTKFPSCRVIAVEPDPDSFRILQQNLAPYRERTTVVRAAIWSHPGRLAFSESGYRDGRSWTRQVRECTTGEDGSVEALDVPALMRRTGCDRISLLKMDIEGAEAVVFAGNTRGWLPRVDAIAIELHDDSQFGMATPIFLQAIQSEGFRVVRSGEFTVCRRADPAASTRIRDPAA